MPLQNLASRGKKLQATRGWVPGRFVKDAQLVAAMCVSHSLMEIDLNNLALKRGLFCVKYALPRLEMISGSVREVRDFTCRACSSHRCLGVLSEALQVTFRMLAAFNATCPLIILRHDGPWHRIHIICRILFINTLLFRGELVGFAALKAAVLWWESLELFCKNPKWPTGSTGKAGGATAVAAEFGGEREFHLISLFLLN